MQTSLETTHFYVPDNVLPASDHEIHLLEQMTPKEIQQIDEVRFKVMAPSQTFDVDSLINLRQVSFHQKQRTYWHLIITTVCVLAIFGILCFSVLSYIHRHIVRCHSINTTVEPSTLTPNPLPVTPEPSQRTHLPRSNEPQREVTFSSYWQKPAE